MSRRKRFELPKKASTFSLNITSMTDMFTILLVFLLQTYSTAEIQVAPETGQALPISNSDSNPIAALQVSVTRSELKVGDRVIASLKNDNFVSKDIDAHDINFIVPLFQALEQMAKSEKAAQEKFETDQANGTLPVHLDPHGKPLPPIKPNAGILDGRILVKADQNLSYGVLRKVMYTASMAGFPKLKMATVVGN